MSGMARGCARVRENFLARPFLRVPLVSGHLTRNQQARARALQRPNAQWALTSPRISWQIARTCLVVMAANTPCQAEDLVS